MSKGIASLVDRAKEAPVGKRIKAGNWSAVRTHDGHDTTVYEVYHYGTRMLELTYHNYPPSWGEPWQITDGSVGWGSASDQQGVNKVFDAIGAPYKYRRDYKGGGPRIVHWPPLDGEEVEVSIRGRFD